MGDYRDQYSAQYVIDGEYTLKSGAVMRLYHLPGVDDNLISDCCSEYVSFLNSLEPAYTHEFLLVRADNTSSCDAYDAVTDQAVVRAVDITRAIRNINSRYYRDYGKANSIYFAVSTPRFGNLFRGQRLQKAKAALDGYEAKLANSIPIERLSLSQTCTVNYHLYSDQHVSLAAANPYMDIPSQLINQQPLLTADGNVQIGDRYSRRMLLHYYPDSFWSFWAPLVYSGINIRIKLCVKKGNTQAYLSRSRISNRQSRHDTEEQHIRGDDAARFRLRVLSEGGFVFDNYCLLTVTAGDEKELNEDVQTVCNYLLRHGATVNMDRLLQPLLLVNSLSGENTLRYRRPDDSHYLASFLPTNRVESHSRRAHILRFSSRGSHFLDAIPEDGVNHGFTVGKSGGGKDTEMALQIAETYGLGVDYFILEVAPTYQGVVDMLGGRYIDIDPERDYINIFPQTDAPLSSEEIVRTATMLTPLLTDREVLSVLERHVVETIVEKMYQKLDGALNYVDFLHVARSMSVDTSAKKAALQGIINNVDSLINAPSGSVFHNGQSLAIEGSIIGINLKRIIDIGNAQLSMFYFSAICSMYKRLAEGSRRQSVIILNELHEFSALAPRATANLIREITRMGRKERMSVVMITQSTYDITRLDDGVKNNLTRRKFVYMPDGHDEVAGHFPQLAGKPLAAWKALRDPDQLKSYREQLFNVGDSLELLTIMIPPVLLSLFNSKREMLEIKKQVLGRKNLSFTQKLEAIHAAAQKRGFA